MHLYYMYDHSAWAISSSLGSADVNLVLKAKPLDSKAVLETPHWYASDGNGGWVQMRLLKPKCNPRVVLHVDVDFVPTSCAKEDLAKLHGVKAHLHHILRDHRLVPILNKAGLKTSSITLHGNMVENNCDVHLQLFTPTELSKKQTAKVECKWSGGSGGVSVKHTNKVQ
jgi:hypothetical protein